MKRLSPFILIYIIGGLAIFSSTISKNPVLPILAREIGATQSSIGIIAAASTIVGILVSLPSGILSDRMGRKKLLIASGIIFLTAPFFYFLIKTPFELTIVRCYHGLATAIFGPVSMAFITDLSSERRGERLGYFSSTQLVGRSLAPVAGGLILSLSIWQGVYVLCAIAGGVALVAMFLLPGAPLQETSVKIEAAKSSIHFTAVLRNRGILLTSLARAAQYFAFGAVETFLPLYALSVGIDAAGVGLLFGLQIAVRALTRPITGMFSDRRGRKPPIIIGLFLVGISTPFFTFTNSWLLMAMLSLVFGAGFSLASGATSALVSDQAPEGMRGAALGFMSTVMDIGQAAGPILLGVILTFASYPIGFMSIGVLVLIVSGLFTIFVIEKK
jgi:DHA1 family multidrug resistance protein-like MFS transporter